MCGAVLHHADGVVAGHSDNRHFRRLGQIGEALVAFVSLHLGARRIDREDLALEAELVEVVHRPAADLVGIFRGADDGHRFRVERGTQTSHGLVLVKYGMRRSVKRRKSALTRSPILRSRSPCAIMRKPSAASTRTIL